MTAVVLQDSSWLVASAAATGAAATLLARQAEVGAPVKAVAPADWRAELPECAGAVEMVRAALAAVMQDGPTAPPATGNEAEILAAIAAESGMAWTNTPAGLTLRVDSAGAVHSIAASVRGGSVYLRSALLRRPVPEGARDAMCHFLLALNARLRLARAGWADSGVTLEVALPAAGLTAFLMVEAVRALGAGFRMARRECASLLDGRVAKQYREFHLANSISHEEKTNENTNA
ncbi:MAG: hypothetical protein P4L56_29155 [Candidatus Sulfopaludibacter sp.]|nr:hypothetical protein [Candidatus Sulfopaludibacter sp.]